MPNFVEVGDRVRWISERKFRYENWPPDVWVKKGVEGTVTEIYPEGPREYSPEEREWYTIPPAAAVKWDNGAECLIHRGEDTPSLGQVWEKIKKEPVRLWRGGPFAKGGVLSELWGFTVNELRAECRKRSLPWSGNKEDLVRRLSSK